MLRSAEAQLLFYRFVLLDSLCLGWTGGRLQHVNHRQFNKEKVLNGMVVSLGRCVPEDGFHGPEVRAPPLQISGFPRVLPALVLSYKSRDGLGETRTLQQASLQVSKFPRLCMSMHRVLECLSV